MKRRRSRHRCYRHYWRISPRALLTTTVQGYEGTGRGFLLKFCATLGDWHHLTLTDPIRWATDDPLERVMDNAMLFHDELLGNHPLPKRPPVAQIEIPPL